MQKKDVRKNPNIFYFRVIRKIVIQIWLSQQNKYKIWRVGHNYIVRGFAVI